MGALLLSACVAYAAPSLPELPIPQCFGVNIHFVDKDLPDHIALLKKAGFGWVRRDLNWEFVERKKGVYDFSEFDKLIDATADANIRVVAILDYGNPLYDKGASPISPQARAAFARFAAAAATHYAGKGIVWEIYNEPNWTFWKPKPDVDQYIALADEATAAIRAADPDAIIVGPALAGPITDRKYENAHFKSLAFLNHILAMPTIREWSAITLHPYRNKEAPETASLQLEQARGILRQHGIDPAKTPLIAGEWGYSTWLRGVDEPTQAAYAVRELLWATVEHMPFTIWYDWQDDGPNRLNREYRFGLLRAGPINGISEANIAKPSFIAISQVTQLLRGYRFDALIPRDDAVVIARYARNGDSAYAIWSKDNMSHRINLDLPSGDWQIMPMGGKMTDTSAENITVVSGAMPTMIRKIDPSE
jgi:hypothetical protein